MGDRKMVEGRTWLLGLSSEVLAQKTWVNTAVLLTVGLVFLAKLVCFSKFQLHQSNRNFIFVKYL